MTNGIKWKKKKSFLLWKGENLLSENELQENKRKWKSVIIRIVYFCAIEKKSDEK